MVWRKKCWLPFSVAPNWFILIRFTMQIGLFPEIFFLSFFRAPFGECVQRFFIKKAEHGFPPEDFGLSVPQPSRISNRSSRSESMSPESGSSRTCVLYPTSSAHCHRSVWRKNQSVNRSGDSSLGAMWVPRLTLQVLRSKIPFSVHCLT